MLRRLWLRDVLLHGRALLISYGLFGAFQVYAVLRVHSPRAWMVFTGIYAATLTMVLFAREDKFGSNAWTCTLPVSRRQLVRARFIGAWLLVAAALGFGAILAAVLPGSQVRVPDLLEPDTLLLAATAISLALTLILPFLIRFGLLGLIVFLLAGQVLGTAMLFLALLVRSGGAGLRGAIAAVSGAVHAFHAAVPPGLYELLVLGLLVAFNWAGYRLSARLFARREL